MQGRELLGLGFFVVASQDFVLSFLIFGLDMYVWCLCNGLSKLTVFIKDIHVYC
jgi:hypothetical protein